MQSEIKPSEQNLIDCLNISSTIISTALEHADRMDGLYEESLKHTAKEQIELLYSVTIHKYSLIALNNLMTSVLKRLDTQKVLKGKVCRESTLDLIGSTIRYFTKPPKSNEEESIADSLIFFDCLADRLFTLSSNPDNYGGIVIVESQSME